jgi:PEP-CTERM motif
MLKSLQSGLCLSLFLVGTSVVSADPAPPSGPLYIDDANGNIGTVNLSNDAVTVLGNSGQDLTDIAFTANGNLYGTTFTGLYSINKTTGAATSAGSYGAAGDSDMNSLVGAGSGLYAASAGDTKLYAVDVSPFAVTALSGSTSGNSAGDLAFTATAGALYETLSNGNLDKITIAGSTISSTVIGNMGLDDVFGLATGDNGVTYAVAGTEIYSIDLSTAALTPLLDYSGHGLGSANGTAFITEGSIPITTAPEPGSTVLIGVGLVGLALYRRFFSGRPNSKPAIAV